MVLPVDTCTHCVPIFILYLFIYIYIFFFFFSPWSFQIAKSTKCISKFRVKQWNTTCSAVIGLWPSDICSILQAQSSDFGGYTLLIPLLMPSVISIFFQEDEDQQKRVWRKWFFFFIIQWLEYSKISLQSPCFNQKQ